MGSHCATRLNSKTALIANWCGRRVPGTGGQPTAILPSFFVNSRGSRSSPLHVPRGQVQVDDHRRHAVIRARVTAIQSPTMTGDGVFCPAGPPSRRRRHRGSAEGRARLPQGARAIRRQRPVPADVVRRAGPEAGEPGRRSHLSGPDRGDPPAAPRDRASPAGDPSRRFTVSRGDLRAVASSEPALRRVRGHPGGPAWQR